METSSCRTRWVTSSYLQDHIFITKSFISLRAIRRWLWLYPSGMRRQYTLYTIVFLCQSILAYRRHEGPNEQEGP
jgi:hypothetical protein